MFNVSIQYATRGLFDIDLSIAEHLGDRAYRMDDRFGPAVVQPWSAQPQLAAGPLETLSTSASLLYAYIQPRQTPQVHHISFDRLKLSHGPAKVLSSFGGEAE